MNQNKQAPRRRMTRREWRIRRCLRLARNWAVFLAACGAAVALMTSGILWLLPKAHALIAGPEAFDAQKQVYLEKGLSEEEAAVYAASVCPPANASEQATGYAADILSPDCTEKTTRFADTRAYEWLTAYAAEYGFVLRWPEERQAATGMIYEPWHWRYVGVENALAIRASGLSLEEFLALERTKL